MIDQRLPCSILIRISLWGPKHYRIAVKMVTVVSPYEYGNATEGWKVRVYPALSQIAVCYTPISVCSTPYNQSVPRAQHLMYCRARTPCSLESSSTSPSYLLWSVGATNGSLLVLLQRPSSTRVKQRYMRASSFGHIMALERMIFGHWQLF